MLLKRGTKLEEGRNRTPHYTAEKMLFGGGSGKAGLDVYYAKGGVGGEQRDRP